MNAGTDPANGQIRHQAGLCADCRHAQMIRSSRQAMFWLCRLSTLDPRFPKYPALPVIQCQGYERSDALTGPAHKSG